MHLHGYWDEPASVVLGIRSYEQVPGEATPRALQRAMATTSSLVLVSADDPNIGALCAAAMDDRDVPRQRVPPLPVVPDRRGRRFDGRTPRRSHRPARLDSLIESRCKHVVALK